MGEVTFELFQGLADVVDSGAARLRGEWAAKSVRRYASPEQSGTGEGPFIDAVDWRWEGAFEGASPLAGVALLSVRGQVYWVKSHPPVERPVVRFTVSAWADRTRSVTVTGRFHGAYPPGVPAKLADEPRAACVMGEPLARIGAPHVVGQVDGVVFAVVLLPGSLVKVGRNRLWHLREKVASGLSPELQRLLTTGRSGEITGSRSSA